ncbi:IclR family transcriptional regulator [Nocardia farcinica]|uniref:IclR family transcriptional regulator n=1 Tax=Nocardia farcinica TaxID=37329 RepID=UPI00189443F1|nr:IclR family transcriptional regulator [Nocardia farcinica]MBF6139043.1 IclR family transcriptional regulator [Nocardia farcinica]MBF6383558.1 IclR family transcriptional regulator [Nocardia farcinica]MBF6537204.1 IclR family transcriptional regulator [Nocardia farcinica]
MGHPFKAPPAYAITSVDNALRIAAMLQLEGSLTVSEVAERIGVAASTAHRLLRMLVYRDFAVQDSDRAYRVGPLLELAAHSRSAASRLRAAALPELHRLVDQLGESANLVVRTADTVRFVASVECAQALRVGSREGMVFPAQRTSGGLVLLAEVAPSELAALYAPERFDERPEPPPDLGQLADELAKIRRNGFAVNDGRSERGVVAVGVAVRDGSGTAVAALSVSMPAVRYDNRSLPRYVAALRAAAAGLQRELG